MKKLTIAANEAVLCSAEVADNPLTRGWGLLGRKGLGPREGLLIKPCKSVHTFFMRFPIDVVYLDRAGEVVKTCSRLRPYRFSNGSRGTHSVLELPAGAIEELGIAVGQKLGIGTV